MALVMGDLAAANLAIAELYTAIGRQVAVARQELGVTQLSLSTAVGLTRSAIANIEAGRQRPPVHVVIAIAQALHVEPSALICGDKLPVLAPPLPTSFAQLRGALLDAQSRISVALEQLPPEE